MLRKKTTMEAARAFFDDFVMRNRQWDTLTIQSYLPIGWHFDGASYAGPATVSDIAAFMRREARKEG